MIRSEFDATATRITEYWKRYGDEQMNILWNMIKRHGITPGALDEAIDKLMEEYPPQKPPRLRSIADMATNAQPNKPNRAYNVGDWVEVDAQYSERVIDGKHFGQIAPFARTKPVSAGMHIIGEVKHDIGHAADGVLRNAGGTGDAVGERNEQGEKGGKGGTGHGDSGNMDRDDEPRDRPAGVRAVHERDEVEAFLGPDIPAQEVAQEAWKSPF